MPLDFDADVITRSHTIPVLVDFWAPWCGPCRVLGPTLDKLAEESAGRWELCKVNTDDAPGIAQRYGVRGIPAVKLFVQGEIVKEFTGALGEAQVRAWLREALPSEEEARLKEAEALMDGGDVTAALPLLMKITAQNPDYDRARIRLAQLLATRDLSRAHRLVEDVDADRDLLPVVEAIRMVVSACESRPSDDAPGRMLYTAALEAIGDGDFNAALRHVIAVLQQDRFYGDDAARKLGVALFTILGPAHALTKQHRRTFDMWLY